MNAENLIAAFPRFVRDFIDRILLFSEEQIGLLFRLFSLIERNAPSETIFRFLISDEFIRSSQESENTKKLFHDICLSAFQNGHDNERPIDSESDSNCYILVEEASFHRGVSKQAIRKLIKDGKVSWRRGDSGLIEVLKTSLDSLPTPNRKRTVGEYILAFSENSLRMLGEDGGVIWQLQRPNIEHAMVHRKFGFVSLYPDYKSSDLDDAIFERYGVRHLSRTAFATWLKAYQNDMPHPSDHPLVSCLRKANANILRFELPPTLSCKPFFFDLAEKFGGGSLQFSIHHAVVVAGYGHTDVSIKAPKNELHSIRAFAESRGAYVRESFVALDGEHPWSLWCRRIRRDFRAAIKQAIAGPKHAETRKPSAMLDDAVIDKIVEIVEANYSSYVGYSTAEYWIDFNQAIRAANSTTKNKTSIDLPERGEILRRIKGIQKSLSACDIVRSLYDFYGLRILCDSLDWNSKQIVNKLPEMLTRERRELWKLWKSVDSIDPDESDNVVHWKRAARMCEPRSSHDIRMMSL